MKYNKWAGVTAVSALLLAPLVILYFAPQGKPIDWAAKETTNYLLAAIALGIWMKD